MNTSLVLLGWLLFAVGYSAAEHCNETKVVCYVSASNCQFSYDRLGSKLCTHYILIDLMIVNCHGNLSMVEQSLPGELSCKVPRKTAKTVT